jgi:hypothetical protein
VFFRYLNNLYNDMALETLDCKLLNGVTMSCISLLIFAGCADICH